MFEYVAYYIEISKSLQNRKTILLKSAFKANFVRKLYTSRTHVVNFIFLELESFRFLQDALSKSTYLIYHDFNKQLYMNLNVSKKFEFEIITYHVIEEKIK